jgi:hypothetical protein
MRWLISLLLLVSFSFSGCKKDGNNKNSVPQITLISVTPTEIKSGDAEGNIIITFNFTDGDADLLDASGSTKGFISQTYDSQYNTSFKLPPVSIDFLDPSKGLVGRASVIVPMIPFVLDSLHESANPFHFELYVTDAAGHQSNSITTPDITIKP